MSGPAFQDFGSLANSAGVTAIDMKPMFGPLVADDVTVSLPAMPSGLTTPLATAIDSYRTAFFSDDDDGETAAQRMHQAAHKIAAVPATSHADIAAKLIIGLHESHPSKIGDQLALDAASFETDASGRILLSVLDDLIGLATPPAGGEWQTLVDAQRSAHADTMERGLEEDEVDRRCSKEDKIVLRLLDVPPRTFAEFVEKLRIAFGWAYSPARGILEKLLSDGQRLASLARADRAEWEKVETEYRTAWALWDELPAPYTNEESDAVGGIAFSAMHRMMDTPAPDAAAMLVKMIAASEGSRMVTADDMDALIADARRFAGPRIQPTSPLPATGHEFVRNQPVDKHADWIGEYERVRATINDPATEEETPEYEALCERMSRLEDLVVAWPAGTREGTTAKLYMIARLIADGARLSEQNVATAVREAQSAFDLLPRGQ